MSNTPKRLIQDILQALEFHGPLTNKQIAEKVNMRGYNVSEQDVANAIHPYYNGDFISIVKKAKLGDETGWKVSTIGTWRTLP